MRYFSLAIQYDYYYLYIITVTCVTRSTNKLQCILLVIIITYNKLL